MYIDPTGRGVSSTSRVSVLSPLGLYQRTMRSALLVSLISIAVVAVRGDSGECRYDSNFCSCKLGSDLEGVCWDRVSGTPFSGTCINRLCNAGWSCACQGRTHLCPLIDSNRHVVDGITGDGTTICHEETGKSAGAPIIELGNTTVSISRKGLLSNACSQLSWWYNGDLMGVYGTEPEITEENIEEEMEIRSSLTLLEFQPGDLLAFRYKHASYHCFSSYIRFSVNGTIMDTGGPGVSVIFSRAHSHNWFTPSFTPNVVSDEALASPTDFVPLRTNFLSSGQPIVPGTDYWKQPDGTEDHKISNFYFLLQVLPSTV